MSRAAIGVLLISLLRPAVAAVLVTYESGVEAYAEAFDGLKASLGPGQIQAIDVNAAGATNALAEALSSRDTSVVVAIGTRALGEVRRGKTSAPVVAAMVLGAAEGATSHIDLEIPLAAQLAAMRELYPKRLRVGIIRNPDRPRYSAEDLEQRARKEGYTAVVVESAGPAQLLKAVGALKGKVDFLLLFPDPELYNVATIKPLVLASIEGRLPMVGFSPALVRAGAAAGIYADYRAIGLQTAQIAARLLRGGPAPDAEAPNRLQIAVNPRVARLLGVEFRTDAPGVEVLR